jgi:DNA uptake protein ComE-like DNA-binding protein
MKQASIFAALTAVLLLSTAHVSFAVDSKPEAAPVNTGKTKAEQQKLQKELDAKRKATAKIKLVDINNAGMAELKTLPGIGDAEAIKIIEGRPYGSKAWLATRNILSSEVYDGLSTRVIAKQPYKDSDKNAALYAPKK